MGDGDDLAVLCHLAHDGGHLGRYLTAHARVYLVKDDGGEPLGAGYQCLDAEHQSADFTAGSHLTHGPQTLVEVGSKEQFHLVASAGSEIRRGVEG